MSTRNITTQSVQPALDLDEGRVVLEQKPHAATEASSVSPSRTPRDTSITKVNARYSPRGKRGQKYLAAGIKTSLRLWENEQPGKAKSSTHRSYETLGYVISGRAELEIEGQIIMLEPGDSWVVPQGAVHRYKILEPFTAIEATSPPAEVHGRDEA
jgi:mannose-6-phosphate isomerase-like protein (cupin superfamily)